MFEVTTFAFEERMRLVADDEDDICRNLVGRLIALALKRDFGAGFPAGFDVDGQDLLLLADGAVVAHNPPADLHPLRHALVDVFQRDEQIVLDRRVLLPFRSVFLG